MLKKRVRGLVPRQSFLFLSTETVYLPRNWYSSPAKEIWLNPKYHPGVKFIARLSSKIKKIYISYLGNSRKNFG